MYNLFWRKLRRNLSFWFPCCRYSLSYMTYIHFYDAIQCLLPISPCFWGDGEEAQSNRAFFDAVKVAFSYSRNFSVCLRNQNSRKPTCLRPAPPRPRSIKRRVNWLPSGRLPEVTCGREGAWRGDLLPLFYDGGPRKKRKRKKKYGER